MAWAKTKTKTAREHQPTPATRDRAGRGTRKSEGGGKKKKGDNQEGMAATCWPSASGVDVLNPAGAAAERVQVQGRETGQLQGSVCRVDVCDAAPGDKLEMAAVNATRLDRPCGSPR